jgi:hypothetical protein
VEPRPAVGMGAGAAGNAVMTVSRRCTAAATHGCPPAREAAAVVETNDKKNWKRCQYRDNGTRRPPVPCSSSTRASQPVRWWWIRT